MSLHSMGAMLLKTPELMLSDEEGAMLAKSVANVAQYYPDTVMSEKTMAHLGLAMVAFGIYGTRIGAIAMRKRNERQQRAMQAPNVTRMKPAPDIRTAPGGYDITLAPG